MATVIKASGAARASDRGSFNFDDMEQRASQYLETVRQRAIEILAKAHDEAAAIRTRAEAEGRTAALKAAEQIFEDRVAQQLTTLTPALNAAIQGINTAKAEWLSHWERTAVSVSAAMAERIIRRKLDAEPQIALNLITEALQLAAGSGEIQLRLNPDDHAALGTQIERLAGDIARLAPAKIVADPSITRGGCRVDTRFGAIDQQVESQLARLCEELT